MERNVDIWEMLWALENIEAPESAEYESKDKDLKGYPDKRKPGYLVETKSGLLGRVFSNESPVNGKIRVYCEGGKNLLCNPDTLKVKGFFKDKQNVNFYPNGEVQVMSVIVAKIQSFDLETGRISAESEDKIRIELTFPPLSIPELWDFLEPNVRERLTKTK